MEIKTLETAKLRELDGKLDKARQDLHEVFEQAGDDLDARRVKAIQVANGSELRDWVNAQSERIEELKKDRDQEALALKAIADNEKALNEPAEVFELPGSDHRTGRKAGDEALLKRSVGELAVAKMFDEAGVARYLKNQEIEIDLPVEKTQQIIKTTMTTAAGWAPEDIRIGRTAFAATRPAPMVSDLFPIFPFSQSTVKYMRESTFTNSAAEAAENANLAESALAYTETSDEVRKIGTTLPVTVEQLEDVPQLRGIIDQRMRLMLNQRVDLQLLVGNGTAPNISGIHDRASINTQAKGADTDQDAVFKAITACRVTGFAEPDAAVFHPNDWQAIRLVTTADGIYLWGPPSQQGADTIWGLPVLLSTAETATQALVGAFQAHSAIYLRRGITVEVTNSHASEFIADVNRLKMTLRMAMAAFREEAFTQVTGL